MENGRRGYASQQATQVLPYIVAEPQHYGVPPAFSLAGIIDLNKATSQGRYPQISYGEQQQQQQHSSTSNNHDDFYNDYQTALGKTFEHTRDGRLSEAGQQLFRLSDWLLKWAETLGLVCDNENQYQQRLTLWEEFNVCWLTAIQRQKEMIEKMITTGQRPQPPQTLISHDFLEKMGTKLVKDCDAMEKHGLVDYQMGVWEEEIIAMLTSCMDLLNSKKVATQPRANASYFLHPLHPTLLADPPLQTYPIIKREGGTPGFVGVESWRTHQ